MTSLGCEEPARIQPDPVSGPYEIVRDGRQRGEAVSQGSEDETGYKCLASHVTRRYVTANWRANRIFADHRHLKRLVL